MDYEKKYNEALERANAAIDIAADKDLVGGVVRTIFPELRESEDERIINQLIALVNSTGEVLLIQTNKEELVAWLNKCKESLHISETCKENADSFTSEDERIRKYLVEELKAAKSVGELKFTIPQPTREECIAYLEKQKEQKPNYCHYGGDPNVERCKYCSASCSGRLVEERYSPLCNTIKDKIHEYIANHFIADTVVKTDMRSIVKAMEEGVRLGKEEQKPAEWSEEDNEMRLEAIRVLVSGCERYRKESGCLPGWHKVIDWLKSLRPQPKPEVTDEEIEEMVTKRARSSGTTKSEMAFYRNGVKDAIKRFGLRPSWKPSEEQMAGLETAISTMRFQLNVGDKRLNSLYEQLKKLM